MRDLPECPSGVTAKCSTFVDASPGKSLAAFGFGPASGSWGGMVADSLRISFADHMLVRVPDRIDPLRIAAASDNLTDAWRSVVPPLRDGPGGSVLVIGGGAQSIGLYAAGLANEHGAGVVDYYDDRDARLSVAEEFGARVHKVGANRKKSILGRVTNRYDVVIEASSSAQGLRDAIHALRPGGVCTGTGYYLAPGTKVPVMDMYATSAILEVGVSSVRPHLPELLDFFAISNFPAEKVTSLLADWDDAPQAYTAHTTKLVLHRERLDVTPQRERHS